MIEPEVAWDKLRSFATPQELRDYFVGEGVVGIPRIALSCPIAVWMTKQTGLPTSVADRIRVGVSTANSFGDLLEQGTILEHTPATFEFMANFDTNLYRELRVTPV